MDIKTRLEQLTPEVYNAFSEDFVFLVSENKVQHFPAREWSKKQFSDELHDRLGKHTFTLWQNQLVAISEDHSLLAVLPRFHELSALQ